MKKTTFKFSDKKISNWTTQPNKLFDLLFDQYQECLVCTVYPSGVKTFGYRYRDNDKKIKYKKLFPFIDNSIHNGVDEARIKVRELQKLRRDGNSIEDDNIKSVEYLAKRFLKEALNGYRVSYLTGKSKLMVQYEKRTKAEIKSYINNYVLLKTKDDSLKEKLTRKTSQTYKDFKNKLLDNLEKSDVEEIMLKLSDTPYTANRLKNWLSTMFEWGIYKKICKINPTNGVGKNIEHKVKTFTPEEDVKKAYNYLNSKLSINSHFKVLVGLSHDTGIRLIHLFGLRWTTPKTQLEKTESRGYVDFNTNQIIIHRAKDKKELKVYLAKQGRAWLEKLRELLHTKELSWAYKSKWVFPKPRTKEDKPFDYDSYKSSLKKMINYLGLPADYKLKFARKTFVTHTARKHGVEIASRKVGHSNTKTTHDHYYTPNDDELKLDSIYGENKDDDVKLKMIKGNG